MMPHCRWPADSYVMDEVLGKKRAYAKLQVGEGDTVLDLGAHVGSFVRWSLNHGAERVAAVEMYPPTLELLRRNFPPERYEPRVTIVPYAAHYNATTTLTRNFRNPMSASISQHNSPDAGGLKIETVGLDTLLDTFDPTKIKVDIENSEYDTLLPFANEIASSRVTRIMAELHTKTPATLALAKQLWWTYHDLGWQCSRHVRGFYEKPNGWNIILAWWR